MDKNTPTFWKDGKRRVRCPNPACNKFIARKDKEPIVSRLHENQIRFYKCCHCGEKFYVPPPRKGFNEKGDKVIWWGAYGSTITADLTGEKIEDTIPIED